MENGKPSVCIFCGSSRGTDPAHAQAARRFGRLVGERGFSLVFGGGYVGLMGEVAHAARRAGAKVTGILPQFLRHLEPPSAEEEEVIFTPDMQERKRLMLTKADAFAILPGGLGTLDEFFEVITLAQLHQLRKPIVLLDVGGFFAPLESLLDHVVAQGFVGGNIRALYRRASTPEDAIDRIAADLSHPTRT